MHFDRVVSKRVRIYRVSFSFVSSAPVWCYFDIFIIRLEHVEDFGTVM